MVLGLQHFDAVDGGGGPILDEESGEELVHVEHGAAVVLGGRPPESSGSLIITTRRVIWIAEATDKRGYAVEFVAIALHAVSRDPEAYPVPCIYTQIEIEEEDDDQAEEDSDSDGAELELSKITEMRIIPADPSHLESLFDVFCQCAELNPDPAAESDEEEHGWVHDGGDGMVVGEDPEWLPMEVQANNPIGQNGDHDLVHSVIELHINDGRFLDADEAGENGNHPGET